MTRITLNSWKWCLLLALMPKECLLAAVVLSNLTQPAQDSDVVIGYNSWQASSFRLAEDAGEYRVNSVTLRLRQAIANPSLRFRIVGESALRPDLTKVQVEFNPPVISGGTTQAVTLNAVNPSAALLQPGQRYWLVGSISQLDYDAPLPGGLVYWSYSLNSNVDATPAPGWTFGTQVATAGTNGSNWVLDTATPFTFSVDAERVAQGMTLALWRSLNPGGPADTATFLASDHDQNGLNGLLDFAFNSKRANLPVLYRDPSGNLVLEYVRWKQAPELSWQIQHADSLSGAVWQTETGWPTTTTEIDSLSERVQVQLPTPGSSPHFFRVTVLKL